MHFKVQRRALCTVIIIISEERDDLQKRVLVRILLVPALGRSELYVPWPPGAVTICVLHRDDCILRRHDRRRGDLGQMFTVLTPHGRGDDIGTVQSSAAHRPNL